MNNNENKLDKAFNSFAKIFLLWARFCYYYYFLLAILNIIFIYFKVDTAINIATILTLISLFLDLCRGRLSFTKILGLIISSTLSIHVLNNTWIGIALGISIIHIIEGIFKILIIKFFSFMFKHF